MMNSWRLKVASVHLITHFAVLLFVISTRKAVSQGPCEFKASFPKAVCLPCERKRWLELVLPPPPGSPELITDSKNCFNQDPVTRGELYPDYAVGQKATLVAKGPYIRDPSLHTHGFKIRKTPFLRYAYSDPSGPPMAYYDLDKVEKYYKRAATPTAPAQDADFQLLEWPGSGAERLKETLEKDKNDKRPELCHTDPSLRETEECKPYKYWMLEFDRENGKLLQYPCNKEEGTEIMAAAYNLAVTDSNREHLDPLLESEQKLWLASGTQSVYRSYIEPLYVPLRYLEKMGHDDEGGIKPRWCSLKEVDCLSNVFTTEFCNERCALLTANGYRFSRGEDPLRKVNCYYRFSPFAQPGKRHENNVRRKNGTAGEPEYTYGDLRTVMDFTFSRNRLILGMRCGIIIVDKILTDQLEFHVAVLKSEEGDTHKFPRPVNRVSSSTCCSDHCDKGSNIVAAYSSHAYQWDNDHKFMYISFNRGDTFEKRIISSPYTPINLIKALYTMYKRWVDYYEILDTPSNDDLEDDDQFLKNLRKQLEWRYFSINEKEDLFGQGSLDPNSTKFMKIKEILEERVPERQARLNRDGTRNIDKTPPWANELINKRRKAAGWLDTWTEEKCASIPECTEKFEKDKSIDWLFNKSDIPIDVWTPKRDKNEPYCGEITSIVTIAEEKRVLALCEVLYGDTAPAPALPPSKNTTAFLRPHGYFAIYSFPIKENLPLVYGTRVSKRIFKCNFIHNMIAQPQQIVTPILVRIPKTSTFIVVNCKEVSFISTDFGKTIFNTVFYYDKDLVEEYCKKNLNYTAPDIDETCVNSPSGEPATANQKLYVRSYRLCALDAPHFVQADDHGTTFLITFSKFYLRGRIGYNSEARLFVGQPFASDPTGLVPEFKWEDRFRNLIFPSRDIDGELVLTVALVNTYAIADGYFKDLYYKKKRHSLRLLPIPLQRYIDNRNFYSDNISVCKRSLSKGYAFGVCETNAFLVQPTRLSLDISEKGTVRVQVKDSNPFLALYMFSSNEKSIATSTIYGGQSQNINLHTWDVHIVAVPNEKDKQNRERLVDAFFGSDYNTLNEFSAAVSLANMPKARCHTQPSATVQVHVGCKGKRLIAHEDAYRPQCKLFQKNFKYRLPKDSFDPDVAKFLAYTESGQKNPFIKFDKGDLEITYDYTSWGCPIEPVATDLFIPDLRVVDEDNLNSSGKAKRFTGNFLLIELFGATGFNYELKVNNRCQKKPKFLKDWIQEWKDRQRIFTLAASRLKFPVDIPTSSVKASDVEGNPIFFNQAVEKYLNILNQGNYLSCNETYAPISDEDKKAEYDIMRTRPTKHIEGLAVEEEEEVVNQGLDNDDIEDKNLNKIRWGKDHQRVYLFLAVSVDDESSVCNYYTIFGVSLDIISEMDDLESFLFFFFFVLLWILLVIGGYHIRKSYVRVAYIKKARTKKLEEAAWKVVYQYEKLLYENDMSLQNEDPPENENGTGTTGTGAAPQVPQKSTSKDSNKAQEQARRERLQKMNANPKK